MRSVRWSGILVLGWLLVVAGCSQPSSDESVGQLPPVAFESGDECHVCGMVIAGFPGPKGEVLGGNAPVRKFCSTRDLFSWLLQPEQQHRDYTVYVHDMAQTDWQRPDDAALVDARLAYYVVGSERAGAMGPTLASFASESLARQFMANYGGRLLRYEEITLAVLQSMTDIGTEEVSGHATMGHMPAHGSADSSE
ncbi:copper chaperone NosL [Marinobacter zhejiangensis]|uniref:Copper chaperone NosL n=1 Tax=Marinobacter zhejiangensis TaxID=488535 RepID=A0A1I4SWV0_9GAMM|nr:copper chaperone NosL [Marinobacter zhejiangensis]